MVTASLPVTVHLNTAAGTIVHDPDSQAARMKANVLGHPLPCIVPN